MNKKCKQLEIYKFSSLEINSNVYDSYLIKFKSLRKDSRNDGIYKYNRYITNRSIYVNEQESTIKAFYVNKEVSDYYNLPTYLSNTHLSLNGISPMSFEEIVNLYNKVKNSSINSVDVIKLEGYSNLLSLLNIILINYN